MRFVLHPPEDSGILFQNTLISSPSLNILNYIYFYNGSGVIAADFNNDGLDDIYLAANQISDKLYLNQGNFSFRDITALSQIENSMPWTTGVSTVDINGDGWLDIYVCKVDSIQNITGKNQLWVNQGVDEDGIPRFKENAAAYNLDFKGLSTQASFFDYDVDGDLDLFLLNHSTNPNQNYGKGAVRSVPDPISGDKLFENKNGIFTDVSEKSGIFQSKIGYGLGVSVGDLNNDGFPDIYVGNDFFENDYLYLNQGDQTFKEVISSESKSLGHTTHYSMGNDMADLNDDGFLDILSVDMLPEDLTTYKTSGTEFNYQIYENYLRNGYAPQYMQNALQLNNGNGTFTETAYASGLAASEWSWSPLIADFNNDGTQDVYITNGILGATNDMDFINFIANDQIQKSLSQGMTEEEMAFINKIPKKHTINYFFRNNGSQDFKNVTRQWMDAKPSFSNGAAYSDLDNDGDLDLIVNNVNEPITLLENKTDELDKGKSNFLKVKFKGDSLNHFGIGSKVILYTEAGTKIRENYPTRGYLSSVPPSLHFGMGTINLIDSLKVIWPDGTFETVRNVKMNQELVVGKMNASNNYRDHRPQIELQYLVEVDPKFDYTHRDNNTLDFNRDPLIPFAYSNEGPDISVGDINNDGLDDLFLSGAKGQASQLFSQQRDGSFRLTQSGLFEQTAINEDVAHQFIDLNQDGFLDLLVGSGGNEFAAGNALIPRVYMNNAGTFQPPNSSLVDAPMQVSTILNEDLDKDGNSEIIIGVS
ncbi:MAG: VCBS repeat-containing protein, partial [Bacteroidia bacterium]|nr:VCBS repeat-containing protein [Bacteroidia bacterium]